MRLATQDHNRHVGIGPLSSQRSIVTGHAIADYDLAFVENIGNLVCPAEFDIGESLKVMILSVPEGDDKILKYPLMFSVADVLIVTKTDYLPDEGFSLEALKSRAAVLNPSMKIIELSARTGDGFNKWVDFLNDFMESN